MVRNSLLKSMADGTFALWFHTIRRRQSGYPAGAQPSGFASDLNKQWYKKHHSKDTYVNDLYVTVIRKADKKGAAKIGHLFNKLGGAVDKAAADEKLRESHKELSEAVYRVLATFRDYGARVLTVTDTGFRCILRTSGLPQQVGECGCART